MIMKICLLHTDHWLGLKSGEEEGSILCTVVRTIDSARIVALNLTVPGMCRLFPRE